MDFTAVSQKVSKLILFYPLTLTLYPRGGKQMPTFIVNYSEF